MKLSDILKDGNGNDIPSLYVEIGYLVFVWQGGAYIDILKRCETGLVYTDLCINVYDYAEGKPGIPFEMNAFINECTSFLDQ